MTRTPPPCATADRWCLAIRYRVLAPFDNNAVEWCCRERRFRVLSLPTHSADTTHFCQGRVSVPRTLSPPVDDACLAASCGCRAVRCPVLVSRVSAAFANWHHVLRCRTLVPWASLSRVATARSNDDMHFAIMCYCLCYRSSTPCAVSHRVLAPRTSLPLQHRTPDSRAHSYRRLVLCTLAGPSAVMPSQIETARLAVMCRLRTLHGRGLGTRVDASVEYG